MCGRYASFRQAQELADIFTVDTVSPVAAELPMNWNVAPTTAVRVIYEMQQGGELLRLLDAAQWGLVPSWAKDPGMGARMINARSETVAEKPSFRGSLQYYRCAVPMEGYYEWQAAPAKGAKQPFYVSAPDGAPLAAAGLYSLWRDELLTCTILTRAARPELREIHDREPVFLSSISDWLNPTIRDREDALELISEPGPELTARPVATTVNSVRNNGPQLIAPLGSQAV